MIIHLLHNHYDKEHLEEVKKEMLKRGAPTIKAYKVENGFYMAIEGCHRLRACKELGLTPKIDILTDYNWNDAYIDDYDNQVTVGYMVDAHSGDTILEF